MLLALVAFALVGCAKDSGADSPPKLKSLTVEEVAARLPEGKLYVFDDNPKESWVKGHVPSAKWLDDDNVTADALPKDKAATLVFYCHNET